MNIFLYLNWTKIDKHYLLVIIENLLLASIWFWSFGMSKNIENKSTDMTNWDRSGLPGWAYFSEELFRLEQELLFRKHWQFVGHSNSISEVGTYMCIDIAGERGLVIRGKDNNLRAFHNLCRHRGSRVVADQKGKCNKSIV